MNTVASWIMQGAGNIFHLNISYSDTQFVFKFKLPSINYIIINWGNGSQEEVFGQDNVLITKTSNYLINGNYKFSLGGDYLKITYIDISNQIFVNGDVSNWYKFTTPKIPLIAFVLDDGYTKDYTIALPLFTAKGQIANSAIITSLIAYDSSYLTQARILELQTAGWEILSHTVTHPDLRTLTPEQLEDELVNSKSVLESFGCVINSLVYPIGGDNATVDAATLLYYRCGLRSVSYQPTTRGFVMYPITLGSLERCNAGDKAINTWLIAVDECFYTWRNAALIFYTHSAYIDEETLGYLTTLLDYINSKGLKLKKINEILDVWETYKELEIYANGTGVNFIQQTSWTSLSQTINFADCNWDSAQVDNALISLSVGCHNCTIYLGGNNANRTSTSDNAVITLNQNGNTIFVNKGILTCQSIQTGTIAQNTITFKINTGANVYINWGDGSASIKITADGTAQAITSNYTTINTTYIITIYGDIDYITSFRLLTNQFTFVMSLTQFIQCPLLDFFTCLGVHTISGDISLLTQLKYLKLEGSNASITVSGSITNLVNLIQLIIGGTVATVSGSTNGLTGCTILEIYGANAVSGDIENLNNSATYLIISSASSTFTYGGGTTKAWAGCNMTISANWTTAVLDAFLINWAIYAGTGTKTADLRGTNQPRSSASDAAVTTLQGKGKTILTN
ncbi:MAG: polysaccharide deacetylase family protein [Candidatus Nanoarchaeia archaeon]|nr:polysaccharide deacetylase family protein [Candidatus Nanoarchaeia archaeon]